MGGGKQPSTVNQTSTFSPPGYIQDPLERYVGRAEETYYPGGGDLTPYPFPNQQVAPFNELQQAGFAGIETMGASSPYISEAIQSRRNMLGTNAVNNPLLGAYFKEAATEGLGQLRGGALRGGGFGGSGSREAEGRYLGNLAANIYQPAWAEHERLRSEAAFGAPGLTAGSYIPSQQLLQAGGIQQQQGQTEMDVDFENMMREAGWPFQALEMLGLPYQIGYGAGGGTTVSQIPTTSQFGPFRL